MKFLSFTNSSVLLFLSVLYICSASSLSGQSLFDFSTIFSYPQAKPLNLMDLYGTNLNIEDYKDKILIVSFLDKKSQEEAIEWVESLPSSYLGSKDIVFINVIYPGGVSVLVPRGKVVERLRNDIHSLRTGFRKGLSPEDKSRMDATEIRWAADWERKWSQKWGSMRHMVNIFIIDRQGILRDTIRGMNDRVVERLNLVVNKLLESGE